MIINTVTLQYRINIVSTSLISDFLVYFDLDILCEATMMEQWWKMSHVISIAFQKHTYHLLHKNPLHTFFVWLYCFDRIFSHLEHVIPVKKCKHTWQIKCWIKNQFESLYVLNVCLTLSCSCTGRKFYDLIYLMFQLKKYIVLLHKNTFKVKDIIK